MFFHDGSEAVFRSCLIQGHQFPFSTLNKITPYISLGGKIWDAQPKSCGNNLLANHKRFSDGHGKLHSCLSSNFLSPEQSNHQKSLPDLATAKHAQIITLPPPFSPPSCCTNDSVCFSLWELYLFSPYTYTIHLTFILSINSFPQNFSCLQVFFACCYLAL